MNTKLQTLIATAILSLTTTAANAVIRPQSKTILVESPANLPVLAQADSEAILLHATNDGRTLLYIEANQGRQLTALDVTDPATIKRVARADVSAPSAYDFVQPVGANAELIRYRNGAGLALIDFKHFRQPVIENSPALSTASVTDPIGQTGLLLSASETVTPASTAHNYQVVDTANPAPTQLLASITNVEQRLTRGETGTTFLLTSNGVTLVRQPQVEIERRTQLMQQEGN